MFSGKRTKYYYSNEFTSIVLISIMTLLISLFATLCGNYSTVTIGYQCRSNSNIKAIAMDTEIKRN